MNEPRRWMAAFLRERQLEKPDRRALYAYRCRGGEFASLQQVLQDRPSLDALDAWAIRAFVLYAAEWWQRRYDGRHWTWEPLLASIGWDEVPYAELYEPVRRACAWWKIDLVRLPSAGTRYLGTFACQGGLPLALVGGSGGKIIHFLRAVLKHTAAYRRFVDDAIELAKDQQHLLRPPTLRRDYVFRLTVELIETVLDLQSDAQGDDPLQALDRNRPNWRESMPLDLGNQRARELLTELLEDARERTASAGSDFGVERFLRQTGEGWRLGARLQMPRSLSSDDLARLLAVSPMDLPLRLEVRIEGGRVVGLYAAGQTDSYALIARDSHQATALWNEQAAGEIRLLFLERDLVGKPVDPRRGGELGELPWAFRSDDDECVFVGEGTVSDRSPDLVVLVPPEYSTNGAAALDAGFRVLNREFWRITGPTAIETDNGRCMIRPSEKQSALANYRLSGSRFYDLGAAQPLFRGEPTLYVGKTDQAPRAVPRPEVGWRRKGGVWLGHPDGFGLWDVRHVRDGELRYLGHVGVLPDSFNAVIEPGSDMTAGRLVLRGARRVRVSAPDVEADVEAEPVDDDTLRLGIAAKDPRRPPVRVSLRMHWQGGAELPVQAPFPGHGGRFHRDGHALASALAVDDLYGVRATSISPDESQRFWLEGELKAPDLNRLVRVAHFRRQLRRSGVVHELALTDVRSQILLLLGASSSTDARVVLRIVDRAQNEHVVVEVKRFAAELKYDPGMAFVYPEPSLDGSFGESYEALPVARPDKESVPLETLDSAAASIGARLPESLNLHDEPWLVTMLRDNVTLAQPIVVGGRTEVPGDAVLPLSEALRFSDSVVRSRKISESMDRMLAEHENDVEEDWEFLTRSLLRTEGNPAAAIDLLTVLVKKPRLLVRCVFRLEDAPRQLLWRTENDLPFSWLLVRRDIWWEESRLAFDSLREQLHDGDEIARDHVNSVLNNGTDHIPGLCAVATDVALRLDGAGLSDSFAEALLGQRDAATPEYIRLHANMNDWPRGWGRGEWAQELRKELPQALWQHKDELRDRQPFFDTPAAAAWCCIARHELDAPAIFVIKRTRAHDPEWFDLAYGATWARLARVADKKKAS